MEIVCILCEAESEISHLFEKFHSRAMIHAVSSEPLISAVRAQSQVSTVYWYGLWWTKWHWDRLLCEQLGSCC
jgi:hypothetical protein